MIGCLTPYTQPKEREHVNTVCAWRVCLRKRSETAKSVMVSLWSMPEQKVVLACRLTNTHPKTGCQWKSPNQILIATTNLTNR
ncbi:unnamed protein product [Timema podura]|uniref:Uncharacterized protein n=1 Tax=Timema podura TaxID=61482 RepID=A0ABN7NYV3_TIMPD|nr:unnamed protein product [Timema podura]